MFFDPVYFLFAIPGLLLAMWAQARVQMTYHAAQHVPASMTGAKAARTILDRAGLWDVQIEMQEGHLSDHYDPRHKVLRLSRAVYQERSAAAVGIAAHEAGHALQDAEGYAPLVVRNAAVGTASFGSGAGIWMVFLGFLMQIGPLVYLGIGLFSVFVFFQLVNLPVEFNASTRAKERLGALGIADGPQLAHVNRMLSAAALTYVAATLTAVLQLLYLLVRFTGNRE